ncbi:serine/threonine-protein kinase grp [Cryptotermes secundus]|uniref:serine/threonine-protein kinase grp n=1 Tax=Cryptotermes secundus TaxID=105785 RepID=UPI000CD7BC28|nr:serine/threonine-protein kinase grp [Cryptotermes secundus]XP_023713085.1 serine/threonine-protein kinase grp [Cryptotermes secundus]XP_033608706.1 serine/threonine-protein kinase grp [Cryptotermes secundus]XP_033608708.1 serine/threonine-protein kinase grp [Cryptotermes secundus]
MGTTSLECNVLECGQEQTLTKRCGTFAYMAPEVLMPPYHGEPANLWSCGINVNWKFTMGCKEYVAWKDGKARHLELFIELGHLAMDLIQKILVRIPSRHAKFRAIKDHQWCNMCFDKLGSPKMGIDSPKDEQHNKRFCSGSEVSTVSAHSAAHDSCALDDSVARLSRSQPQPSLEQHSILVECCCSYAGRKGDIVIFTASAPE